MEDQVGNGRSTDSVLSPTPILMQVTPLSGTSSGVNTGSVAAAFDNNYGTSWSGSGTNVWIEFNFGRTVHVKKVRMVSALPGSSTFTHEILVGPTVAPTTQIFTTTLGHDNNYWFEPIFASAPQNTRYLRIHSTSDYHWPGWYEIEIFE